MTTRPEKSPSAFRTISEVADSMGVPQHVLRFWESKFNQISPMKRGGGRRYYRPEDIQIIEVIRNLLHEDGYTIKGAQKHLREQGVKAVIQAYQDKIPTSDNNGAAQVRNDYDAQILNITRKKQRDLHEDSGMTEGLKGLRIRLERVQALLKEAQ